MTEMGSYAKGTNRTDDGTSKAAIFFQEKQNSQMARVHSIEGNGRPILVQLCPGDEESGMECDLADGLLLPPSYTYKPKYSIPNYKLF